MFFNDPQKTDSKITNKSSKQQSLKIISRKSATKPDNASLDAKSNKHFSCNPSNIAANVRLAAINNKLLNKTSSSSSYSAKNCTALNDKSIDDTDSKHLEPAKSQDRMRSRGYSIEGQIRNWVPSFKSTLQRSLSLQGCAKNGSEKQFKGQDGSTTGGKQVKHKQSIAAVAGVHSHKFFKVDRRVKCSIVLSEKYDSWLVNNGIKAATNFLGSMFILLAKVSLLLLIINQGSSFSSGASLALNAVQPIWLRDGLITIGHESIDDDLADNELFPQIDSSSQEQLDRLSIKPLDTDRLIGQRRQDDNDFSTNRRQSTYDPSESGMQIAQNREFSNKVPWTNTVDNSAVKDERDVQSQGDELFWIERRRLERDRALEPPPWMREQPMRRNTSPLVQQQEMNEAEEIAVEMPLGSKKDLSDPLLAARPSRGRQSRESADRIYENLLKLLAEGSYGTGSFFEELQSEIEQRNNGNQRLQKAQQLSENMANDGEVTLKIQKPSRQQQQRLQNQQQQQQQQLMQTANLMQSEQAQLDAQELLHEPEAVLVVAGDEVSGGEDSETIIEAEGNPKQMSAAYKMASASDYAGANEASSSDAAYGSSSGDSLSVSAKPEQVSRDPPLIMNEVSLAAVRPEEANRLISSADLGLQPALLMEQQPTQSSFHVIEDIDQMDTSQDSATNEHPSFESDAGDMLDSSQQQSDNNNWAAQTEVNNQPMKSYHMKRSVPKLLVQPAPIGSLQQLSILNKEPVTTEALQSGKLISQGRPLRLNEQQLAVALLESGEFTKEQLLRTLRKFELYLEDIIGLSRGTILKFYPLSDNKLLMKLDASKPMPRHVLAMLDRYDFAHGYILMTWPATSRENPIALLAAISRGLAKHDVTSATANHPPPPTATTTTAEVQSAENGDGDDDGENLSATQSLVVAPASDNWRTKLVKVGNQYWISGPSEIEPSALQSSPLDALAGTSNEPASNLPHTFGRIPLTSLADYLSALYAIDQLNGRGFGTGVQMNPTIVPDAKISHVKSYDVDYQRYLAYFFVALGTLFGVYLTFKLMMNKPRRAIRRRFRRNETLKSLWSDSSDDADAEQIGELNHQQSDGKVAGDDLQAANPVASRRRLSNDSGLVSGADSTVKDQQHQKHKPAGIDMLAQRLINILRYHHHYQRHKDAESGELHCEKSKKSACSKARQIENDKKELDEISAKDAEFDECSQSGQQQHFRSSNSYIKSLIDVLSKARAQFPSSYYPQQRPAATNSDKAPLTARDTLNRSSPLAGDPDDLLGAKSAALQQSEDLAGAAVAMSQMDISAAHLILAYMERHLEDREQLRREWLELNGSSAAGIANNKIAQLSLQRLAKVALSEENRAKNRNCSVVPFDRNRVRLTAGSAVSVVASSQAQEQQLDRSSSWGGKQSVGATSLSDYINASYIYDDDPRRPTHIIAQGPSEQTCGQFWQMIWEQGISVIVMLTRLNENSSQMCHCYWPKDNFGSSARGPGDSPELTPAQRAALWKEDSIGASSGQNLNITTSGGGGSSSPTSSNGRRVSVTSVFNTFEARQNGNGQPIIANGDLSNNMICFDVEHYTTANRITASSEITDNEKQKSSDDGGTSQSSNHNGKYAASPDTATRFEVHLVSEHVSSNDYLVRNMYMINRSTGETRTITQFHYLAWPEAGVPDNVRSFLAFRRKVHKSYRNLKSPILVHCSDGGGRSGTYTLIDIILERIKNGAKEIDPRATLEHLRDQRVGLCGTQSQFEFVSVALAEEIQIILNALPQ